MAERGTSKVLGKLQKSLEAGDFYEAHQMYMTVCNRYIKQKKKDEAAKLFATGAKLLCTHKQYGSALELCQMLTETWMEDDSIQEEQLELFFDILDSFPISESQTIELMRTGLKWVAKCGTGSNAEALMHHQCGIIYYEAQKYPEAQNHFLQGTVESAESLASLCIAQQKKAIDAKTAPKNEQFAGCAFQPVLQYLANEKVAQAFAFFQTFTNALLELDSTLKSTSISTSAQTDGKIVVFKVSILNFIQLLLLTVQRGPSATQEFAILRQNYPTGGENDNGVASQLLERIGSIYFKIQPVRQANPLQDLMRSLFSGGEESNNGSSSIEAMD